MTTAEIALHIEVLEHEAYTLGTNMAPAKIMESLRWAEHLQKTERLSDANYKALDRIICELYEVRSEKVAAFAAAWVDVAAYEETYTCAACGEECAQLYAVEDLDCCVVCAEY